MDKVMQYAYHGHIYTYRRVDEKNVTDFHSKTITCCFTGHKPMDIYGFDNECRYKHIEVRIRETIKQLYKKGYRQFITDAEQGFDQLVFWILHEMKKDSRYKHIVNTLYIPFEGQEVRWVPEGIFGQRSYYLMCKEADRVKVICKDIDPGNTYGEIRNAIVTGNRCMLGDSNLLVAWHNGSIGGNVYHSVQDAKVRGLEVINLYEKEPRRFS